MAKKKVRLFKNKKLLVVLLAAAVFLIAGAAAFYFFSGRSIGHLVGYPLQLSWEKLIGGQDCRVFFENDNILLLDCHEKDNSFYYRFSENGKLLEKFYFPLAETDSLEYQDGYLISKKSLSDSKTLIRIYKTSPVEPIYERLMPSSQVLVNILNHKLLLATETEARLVDLKEGSLIKNLNLLDYHFYNPQFVDWLKDAALFKNENTVLIFNTATGKVKTIKSAYNQGSIDNYFKTSDGFLLLTNNRQVLEKYDKDGNFELQVNLPFKLTNLDTCDGKIYVWALNSNGKGENLAIFGSGLNKLKQIKIAPYQWRYFDCASKILVLSQGRKIKGYSLEKGKTLWQFRAKDCYGLMGRGPFLYLVSLSDLAKGKTTIVSLDILSGEFKEKYLSDSVLAYPIIWRQKPAGYDIKQVEEHTIFSFYQSL